MLVPAATELKLYSAYVARSLCQGALTREQLADVSDALDVLAEGLAEAIRSYRDEFGTCPKTISAAHGLEAMRGCLFWVRDEGPGAPEQHIIAKLRDAHRNATHAVAALEREGTAWHFPQGPHEE